MHGQKKIKITAQSWLTINYSMYVRPTTHINIIYSASLNKFMDFEVVVIP
jgi:hypothetical protein